MYLNVSNSRNITEREVKQSYTDTILGLGDSVLNNVNFGLTKTIDRFSFVTAKTLSRFDNNQSLKTILFKPKVIKKLITDISPLEQQDIINNITQIVNNNFPNDGELVEDQW